MCYCFVDPELVPVLGAFATLLLAARGTLVTLLDLEVLPQQKPRCDNYCCREKPSVVGADGYAGSR